MHKSVRKLLALVLLLALPLQGLSAVLMPFHCPSDEQHVSANSGVQHQHEGVTHQHDAAAPTIDQQNSDVSGFETGNVCCNHVYTGAPSIAVFTSHEAPFVLVNHISATPPLFFPEQPLRPPSSLIPF